MKRLLSSNYILLLLASCALLACNEKKENATGGVAVREITFKQAPKGYLLTSHFKNTRMMQLETTDDCIIGEIKKLLRVDGKLFILTKSEEIFCFDENTGKFIRQIGGIGEGPGEYIAIVDMFYNSKENTLCVADCFKDSFDVYSMDGEFLGEKNIGISLNWAQSAISSPDGDTMVAFQLSGGTGANDHAYTVLHNDSTTTLIDPFAPVTIKGETMQISTRPMTVCEDGIRFFKFLNDTIFTLKNGTVTPFCRLDLGRRMPPKEIVAKLDNNINELELFNFYKSGTHMTRLDKIFETRDLMIIIPSMYIATGYYVFEKNKQEGIHVMGTYVCSDEMRWCLQGRSIIEIVEADSKGIISAFEDIEIEIAQEELEKDKNMELFNENLREFFKNADEEGNPCLIFYNN